METASAGLKLRARPFELRRLFTTFGYLVAKQGATAVLGLAYWAVATHLFSARDVGLAAAASSTAFFLAAIGALGIPLLLLAELGSLPAAVRRVTFSTGMYISCLAVLILSLGTLALSPFLGDSLRIIGADPITAALFVIGSVATMGALTFDNAAIGLHRGSAQLWRGSLNSVLKLAIVGVLVLVGTRTAPGLLFAWALALVVSLLVCLPMLRLEPTPAGEGRPQPSGGTRPPLRRALPQAPRPQSVDQFHLLHRWADCSSPDPSAATGLLLNRAPGVVHRNGHPVPAGAVPVRRDIRRPRVLLHRHVRRTLPLGLALCGGILVVVEVAAPLVLRIFGPAYVVNGTTALRLLVLVGPAYVIKDHYVAIRRAQGRLGHAAKVMAAGTVRRSGRRGVGWNLLGHDGPLHRMGRRRLAARPSPCCPR